MSNISLKDVLEINQRIEDKLDKMNEKFESRVGSLEKWSAEIKGQIVLITGAFAIGLNLAIDYVKKRLGWV